MEYWVRFMRDNAGCNGNIANRIEDLGAEVVIGPFSEWIHSPPTGLHATAVGKMTQKG